MKKDNFMSKRLLEAVLSLTLCAMPLIGFAMDGNGSSGGGQSKNGQLRDLSEHSSCHAGQEVYSKIQTWKNVGTTLSKYNRQIHNQVESELNNATICFVSTPLNGTVISNQDGISKEGMDFEQVAIRMAPFYRDTKDFIIYVDQNEWDRMDSTNQSFLLYHEALHGFTDKDEQVTYINRIRFFVSYLSRLYQGAIESTLEDFNKRVKHSRVFVNDEKPISSFADAAELSSMISSFGKDDVLSMTYLSTISAAREGRISELTYAKIISYLRSEGLSFELNGETMGYRNVCTLVYLNETQMVRMAVVTGVDLNIRCSSNESSGTAIDVALNSNMEMFKLLLDSGRISQANLESVNKTLKQLNRWQALTASKKDRKIINDLLEKRELIRQRLD